MNLYGSLNASRQSTTLSTTHTQGQAPVNTTAGLGLPPGACPPGYQISGPPAGSRQEVLSDPWWEEHLFDDCTELIDLEALSENESSEAHQPPAEDARPAVLQAVYGLGLKQRGTAHLRLKGCLTIEDALAEMLSGANSGKRSDNPQRPRVSSFLGLLKRLTPRTPQAQTYACMCLVNMRGERSNPGLAANYVRLAQELPEHALPAELGPYKNLLIAQARGGIAAIKVDFPLGDKDAQTVHAAMGVIEARLKAYERQATVDAQVSYGELEKISLARRAQHDQNWRADRRSGLKRLHEDSVTSAQDEAQESHTPPTRTTKKPTVAVTATGLGSLERPQPPRLPTVSLAQQPPVYLGLSAFPPPTVSPQAVPKPAAVRQVPPLLPSGWGPAAYAGRLQTLAMNGQLNVLQPVANTLALLASCASRQDLPRAIANAKMTQDGFLGTLALMRTLNPTAACEFALYTVLSYVEQGASMPQPIADAVLAALPEVKAIPRDVKFNLQAILRQPPDVRDALEALIDRLLIRA